MAQNNDSSGKENKPTTPPPSKPIPTDIGKARAGFPSGAQRIRLDDLKGTIKAPEAKPPGTKK
jgi:hypothetical protein